MTDAVNIKINGVEYTDFTDASITKSIETLAGSFSITATSTPNVDFPIKVNSTCEILVQGEKVINGYIEGLSINYSVNGSTGIHSVTAHGRDRTGDLMDDTISGSESSDFSSKGTGVSLKQITEQVLKQFKMSAIKVIDNANLTPFSNEQISGEYGMKVFDFLEKYAQKKQVLLTTNGNGDVVFTQTPTIAYKTQLILKKNAPSLILGASIRINNSKRFHEYIATSQGNPSGIAELTSNPKLIAAAGGDKSGSKTVVDNEIRESRIFHFEPDASTDGVSLPSRTKWEANFRRAQSQKIIYRVEGHVAKDDNEIWKPGKLVYITDDFANINNGRRLISSVTYDFNVRDGSKTLIKLLPDDAFSTIVNKPIPEKKAGKGDGTRYTSLTDAEERAAIDRVRKDEGIK